MSIIIHTPQGGRLSTKLNVYATCFYLSQSCFLVPTKGSKNTTLPHHISSNKPYCLPICFNSTQLLLQLMKSFVKRCFVAFPASNISKSWFRKQVNIMPVKMFKPRLHLSPTLLFLPSLACDCYQAPSPSITILGLWRLSCRAQQRFSVINVLVAE